MYLYAINTKLPQLSKLRNVPNANKINNGILAILLLLGFNKVKNRVLHLYI